MSQPAPTKPSRKPVPKVTNATAAAAVVTILVWVASMAGVDVPAEVAAAAVTLVAAGVGYFTKP